MSDHHPLDVWPLPRDQKPMFINEPWLIDESIYFESYKQMMAAREPEEEDDNRRVYIPLDLNKKAFLRRLEHVLDKFGNITWRNDSNVCAEVRAILSQIEIYDQLWIIREGNFKTDENHMICGHSQHATEVIQEIISRLEAVDTCEDFPYNIINELKEEYGITSAVEEDDNV